MELSTFTYSPVRGWSVRALPALDSQQTLVLVFAAPEFMQHPGPLADLVGTYGRSRVIGCSTAGEIAGRYVHDESLAVAVLRFAHSRVVLASTAISEADSRA